MIVYLARHGQTEENVAKILQGHLPGRLTEVGKAQAEILRDQLRNVPLDAVVSSDLARCVDTVCIAVGDRHLPWEKLELLREINWGCLTGHPIEGVDFKQLPDDVETREMLYERAGRVLDYLKKQYEGKRILVVAHGMVNRSIEAQIRGVTLQHLRSIPVMENAEVRQFKIH